MTPTDIQRLRALAKKARTECEQYPDHFSSMVVLGEFLDAADPATVIALCDLAEKAI